MTLAFIWGALLNSCTDMFCKTLTLLFGTLYAKRGWLCSNFAVITHRDKRGHEDSPGL